MLLSCNCVLCALLIFIPSELKPCSVVVVIVSKMPSIVYCFDNAFSCTLLFVLPGVAVVEGFACNRGSHR